MFAAQRDAALLSRMPLRLSRGWRDHRDEFGAEIVLGARLLT
jgi:hypothetical protein